jgi:hypothetical protein
MMRKIAYWLTGEVWRTPEDVRTDLDERVEAVEERFDGLEHRVDVLEHEVLSSAASGPQHQERSQ